MGIAPSSEAGIETAVELWRKQGLPETLVQQHRQAALKALRTTFPDSSVVVPNTTQQTRNVFDELFSEANVNKALVTVVGKIPQVGELLSSLVSAIWPEPQKPELAWDDIESKVRELAEGLIDADNVKETKAMTEGLHRVLRLYLDEPLKSPQKGHYFTNVVTAFAHDAEAYFQDDKPWARLAFFSLVGTMHLSVLREQHLFYRQIYNTEDSDPKMRKKDLEDAVQRYLTRRNLIIEECVKYHHRNVQTEHVTQNSGYYNRNELYLKDGARDVRLHYEWSEYKGFTSDQKRYETTKQQFEDWSNTGYRADIEALLENTFAWPLYHPNPSSGLASKNPVNVDEGRIGSTTVRRLMLDYPGWIGGDAKTFQKYFNHEELYRKHGPITMIKTHFGDRLYGIEVRYGTQWAPMIGTASGTMVYTLEVRPGELITRLSADAGQGSVSAILLSTSTAEGTTCSEINTCKVDRINKVWWTHRFDGHFENRQGDDARRLLWLTGWSHNFPTDSWICRLQPVFGHYKTWGPLK